MQVVRVNRGTPPTAGAAVLGVAQRLADRRNTARLGVESSIALLAALVLTGSRIQRADRMRIADRSRALAVPPTVLHRREVGLAAVGVLVGRVVPACSDAVPAVMKLRQVALVTALASGAARRRPGRVLPRQRARAHLAASPAVARVVVHTSLATVRVGPVGRPRSAIAVPPRIVAGVGAGAAGAAHRGVRLRLTRGLARTAVLRRLERHADEALGPAIGPWTAGGSGSRARARLAPAGARPDAAVGRCPRARLIAVGATVRDPRRSDRGWLRIQQPGLRRHFSCQRISH
jgi:hypothetical protein